jgi:hypothetical protein
MPLNVANRYCINPLVCIMDLEIQIETPVDSFNLFNTALPAAYQLSPPQPLEHQNHRPLAGSERVCFVAMIWAQWPGVSER